MIACNHCIGQGVVLGSWGMEPCPQCGGTGQFDPPMSNDEKNLNGCICAILLFGVVLLVAAGIAVIKFLAGAS